MFRYINKDVSETFSRSRMTIGSGQVHSKRGETKKPKNSKTASKRRPMLQVVQSTEPPKRMKQVTLDSFRNSPETHSQISPYHSGFSSSHKRPILFPHQPQKLNDTMFEFPETLPEKKIGPISMPSLRNITRIYMEPLVLGNIPFSSRAQSNLFALENHPQETVQLSSNAPPSQIFSPSDTNIQTITSHFPSFDENFFFGPFQRNELLSLFAM
ncbi:hypothetical protein BLNAU_13217 [Blattamonas nauphoetae]|uniref:Uncharacterized protein n=1 Tax=Blattamonas nauphoetae TaxID=2049346 RepID=A0ABQ9XHC1_9EUKA|nr:hypothetical protein BLNAU_13217 [Blattamonas nauphoetae]